MARSKLSLELQRELDVQTATTTPFWFAFLTLHKVRRLMLTAQLWKGQRLSTLAGVAMPQTACLTKVALLHLSRGAACGLLQVRHLSRCMPSQLKAARIQPGHTSRLADRHVLSTLTRAEYLCRVHSTGPRGTSGTRGSSAPGQRTSCWSAS